MWTSPEDLRARWLGDPLTVSDDVLAVLLADVEDIVRREFPDLADRITAGFPLIRVRKVVTRVVIRHLHNPSGERSRMDVGGPFTQNVVYGGGDEPGALSLTDEDRAELSDGVGSGAFTIDTTPLNTVAPLDPSVDPYLWDEI